jgi:hypothetical protein
MKQLTIEELREVMSDQIRLVQSGKGDLDVADSLANMTGKVLKSVALEIAYGEHKSRGGALIDMMEKAAK